MVKRSDKRLHRLWTADLDKGVGGSLSNEGTRVSQCLRERIDGARIPDLTESVGGNPSNKGIRVSHRSYERIDHARITDLAKSNDGFCSKILVRMS